jgi:2-hydroxy-3-oxopropionate reductase
MDVTTEAVGIIGLGQMGGAMARRLHEAGWPVVAWDLSPAATEAAARSGLIPAASPAAVAAAVKIVITSLPDAAAVRSVLFGDGGVAGAADIGLLVIDTSTTSPGDARLLAADLQLAGICFLDAPVTGGPGGAASGRLGIMIGGDETCFERALPVLKALGSAIVHCGPVGSGQVVKACNQLIVVSTLGAVAEALVIAESAGVDPSAAREALMGGYAASPILDGQGGRMLRGDFVPGGKARFNLKDAASLAELSRSTGVKIPVFEAAAAYIRALVDAGGGDLDHSAIVTVIRPKAPAADRPANIPTPEADR